MPLTRILSIHASVPAHRAAQPVVHRFMGRVLEASGCGRALDLLERVYAGSGIEARHSVVPDFGLDDPAGFRLFPPRWDLEPFPTTGDRMSEYERSAVPLAEEAARGALEAAGIPPPQVTHLVVCTCTGFFAPGPDVELVRRLGLRPTVARTVIGFMGCHAALCGLRAADAVVRAEPDALVLLVCVELCSIHYQKRPVPDLIVSGALFADGAAALVCGSEDGVGAGLLGLARSRCRIAPDRMGLMGWRIGDTGFEMRLSREVPAALREAAPAFVADLLAGASEGARSGSSPAWSRTGGASWAIHPGGRKIVEAVGEALGLTGADLEPSLGVLRDFGNMSSPTVLFVIERILRRGPLRGPIIALGFGPGLTLEGAVLEP